MNKENFKFYFSWRASLVNSILSLAGVGFLAFSFVGEFHNNIGRFILYWAIFLPIAVIPFLLFMLYLVIITIDKNGITRTNGFGSKRIYSWEDIEKIYEDGKIFDGASGVGKGISFQPFKKSKRDKTISIFESKKLRQATKDFVPNNLFNKDI